MLSALDPTRKAGGAAHFRPDTKSGGRDAVRFRPDTKSGGGGGGGGGCCPFKARYEKQRGGGGGGGVLSSASGPIQKAGEGEGLFSRRGALPYMKGGLQPPTPPPPWIHLCQKAISYIKNILYGLQQP